MPRKPSRRANPTTTSPRRSRAANGLSGTSKPPKPGPDDDQAPEAGSGHQDAPGAASSQPVGDQLRQLREGVNRRRPDVADAIGISAGRISRIETGMVQPRPDEVEQLTSYYSMLAQPQDVVRAATAPRATTTTKAKDAPIPPDRVNEYVLLRFKDGAVINPTTCPLAIHARTHWVWDAETETATCMCNPDQEGEQDA